jgi:RimJ/RimL family protein N-acetyltransferase
VVPHLRTERLLLREWRVHDRAAFAALNADPAVMEYFPSTLTAEQSDELVDRILEGWADRGFGLWAVEVPASATFIGFVGFSSPSWAAEFTPCVEIGWRLGHHAWGLGYATEAAHAALVWGFANVELPRDEIVSFTTVGNVRSRRVMQRLGMVRDPADDFDHPMLPGWTGRRHVLYRLRRGDR